MRHETKLPAASRFTPLHAFSSTCSTITGLVVNTGKPQVRDSIGTGLACDSGAGCGSGVDDVAPGDMDPATKIVPEGDTKLGAGFRKAEEGVAAIPPQMSAGCSGAADLPPRELYGQRISFSEAVVVRVVASAVGGSSTIVNLGLAGVEARQQTGSSVTKPVRRRKIRSNLARSARRRLCCDL